MEGDGTDGAGGEKRRFWSCLRAGEVVIFQHLVYIGDCGCATWLSARYRIRTVGRPCQKVDFERKV